MIKMALLDNEFEIENREISSDSEALMELLTAWLVLYPVLIGGDPDRAMAEALSNDLGARIIEVEPEPDQEFYDQVGVIA